MIDSAVMLTMARRRGSHRPEQELDRIEDEIGVAVDHYRGLGWFDEPALAYPQPPAPEEWLLETGHRAGPFHYDHIRFESGYQPTPGDPAAQRWHSLFPNNTVSAWVMHHPGPPRPVVVCLHGTGMGRPLGDLGLFRANWLFHKLGVDVVLPVLPLHGPRAVPHFHFPSEDVLHNFQGTLQSVWDVRRILAHLREERGAEHIAVHGVSLGGFIAGLIGDLEPDLGAVILGAPVAELGALIAWHKPGPVNEHEARNLRLSHQLDKIISPLALPAAVPLERRFIYAGVVDKMVHHRYHGGRIWEHWDHPEALWYDGGHASLGYDRSVARYIRKALLTSGVIGPRD